MIWHTQKDGEESSVEHILLGWWLMGNMVLHKNLQEIGNAAVVRVSQQRKGIRLERHPLNAAYILSLSLISVGDCRFLGDRICFKIERWSMTR